MTTTRLICLPTTWTVMQRRPRRPKRKKTQCWTKWVKLESGRYKFETCHTKVSWEFKWKTDDAELHGPHTSQKMLDWQVGNLSFGFVSIFLFFSGVWLLRCWHSCAKSWHWGVQGFQEDWFWALCLAPPTSLPGCDHYYFAERKTGSKSNLAELELVGRAGWMLPPPLSPSCSMTGRRRSPGSRTPRFELIHIYFLNDFARFAQVSHFLVGAQCGDIHHQQGGPHHRQHGGTII